jgi:hypothetical protein
MQARHSCDLQVAHFMQLCTNHSAAIDFKMLGLLIEQQYLDFNFDLN